MSIHPCFNFSSLFERNTEEWHLLSLHHYPDQHPLALRGEVKQMFHREQVRQQSQRVQVMKETVWGSGTREWDVEPSTVVSLLVTRAEEPSVSVEEGGDRTTSGSAMV